MRVLFAVVRSSLMARWDVSLRRKKSVAVGVILLKNDFEGDPGKD